MQFITQLTLAVASATKVLSARCECEAGMGKCNHVIGLLYLLAHYHALGLKTVPPAKKNVFTSNVERTKQISRGGARGYNTKSKNAHYINKAVRWNSFQPL